MPKIRNVWNVIIPVVFLIMIVLIGMSVYLSEMFSQETIMFFNSETDLPDNLLIIKDNESIVNKIFTGTEYEIIFTILAGETGKYQVVVDSAIHQFEKEFELTAGEKKKFTLKVKSTISEKWELNSTKRLEWKDEIDITKDSWLAGKRDYAILMNNNTLPTIVMEDYHLPISNEINRFGQVYHINLDISELKKEPYSKIYQRETANELIKELSIEEVELYIDDDVLMLEAKETVNSYESHEKIFLIKLFSEGDIEVGTSGFRKPVSELSFNYQII